MPLNPEDTVAYRDGWFAHKARVNGASNPYKEAEQPQSHSLWTSGWTARFSAIKHGRSMEMDEDFTW